MVLVPLCWAGKRCRVQELPWGFSDKENGSGGRDRAEEKEKPTAALSIMGGTDSSLAVTIHSLILLLPCFPPILPFWEDI